MEVVLCDRQPALVQAWRKAFAEYAEVQVLQGDMMDVEADAYVSPANGFGIMDGGIDLALRLRFPGVDRTVQAAIARQGPFLPVGQAIVVETGDPFIPYLISAPTMRVPTYVGNTSNAALAMGAILRAVDEFNATEERIGSVCIPGLGTGVGGMSPADAAQQMAQAYEEWVRASG